jgi:hypothetical protein
MIDLHHICDAVLSNEPFSAKNPPTQCQRTMQQECCPPHQGLWLIDECIFVENAFALTF